MKRAISAKTSERDISGVSAGGPVTERKSRPGQKGDGGPISAGGHSGGAGPGKIYVCDKIKASDGAKFRLNSREEENGILLTLDNAAHLSTTQS